MSSTCWGRRAAGWRKAAIRTTFFLPAFLAVAVAGSSSSGLAQVPSAIPSDILGQVQQRLNGGAGDASENMDPGASQNQNAPTIQYPDQDTFSQRPLQPSRLEQIMSARAGAKLTQFGYDQLGRGKTVAIAQAGAVQDDYVLGPGDQITVALRGQENSQLRVTVDRNGQVVLPRLNPISAAGRSFGSFRQDLEAAVHRAFVATDAFVSIGRVRQINVLVSGEVNNPGQRIISGLSSVVDAILLSGGIKKSGSLRDIRIVRGNRTFNVDLYSVITGGGAIKNLALADGDRIVVPPLGPVVAVSGLVRLPAIFELQPHQSSIAVRRLLVLAGGQEIRGRFRLSVMRIDADGRSSLMALPDEAGAVHDSEILFVQLGADQAVSQATLSGSTALAGAYPIVAGTRLSDIIHQPGALPDLPYTLFGLVSRKDARTYLRQLQTFTPVAVLANKEDQALQGDDIVRVLSLNEVRLARATLRIYLQRQNEQQQALRDPLSENTQAPPQQPQPQQPANNPQTAAAPLPQNLNTALAVNSTRSTAAEASEQEAGIQLIGDLTQRQLDMVDSKQVRLEDFQYRPNPRGDTTYERRYIPSQENSPVNGNLAGRAPQYDSQQALLPSSGGQAASYNLVQERQQPQNFQDSSQPPAPNFENQEAGNGVFPSNREAPTFNVLAQQLKVDPLVLINFFNDHQVTLDGAVRGPGVYFVGPNADLQDLVQAAGGTINWADTSGVELISTAIDPGSGHAITQRAQMPLYQGQFASYIVKPFDEFRFNQVFTDARVGSVTVQGEVRFKGTYQITRGERLSDLLSRAGGLTGVAFPYGTVFLRKSIADKERDSYVRTAKDVEDQLIVAMTRVGSDKIAPETFTSMQSFVNDLRNQKAVGRMSVIADPSVLAAKPELDPLLEPGDVIYIPQRPSTVSVLGQVMQAGSFAYRANQTLEQYIEQAGGYSQTADGSNVFVVLPDGTARKAEKSWLTYSSNNLPPGSTIVVPRDVTPLDLRQTIIDISQVFSQFAVAIASVAVLSKQ
jgi:protein involved in polysaccharide export with SLBB domain